MTISPDARIYLRPTAFIDAPFGYDGRAERLAGGLIFFSAWELIAAEHGRRIAQSLVPVDEIGAHLADLTDKQANAARQTIERVVASRPAQRFGDRMLRFDQPQVMGILNVSPDSFSDGGRHIGDDSAIADAGFDMIEAGAAIVDVGGESTRPGAATVWEGDEISRTEGVVRRLVAGGALVSIDTRKAAAMAAALDAGEIGRAHV